MNETVKESAASVFVRKFNYLEKGFPHLAYILSIRKIFAEDKLTVKRRDIYFALDLLIAQKSLYILRNNEESF